MTSAAWVCSCGHKNFGAACYGGCGKEKPPSAASGREYAQHVIAEIDTHGDPRIYELAEDYLRLWETIDCLLPANGCSTVEEAVAAFGAKS